MLQPAVVERKINISMKAHLVVTHTFICTLICFGISVYYNYYQHQPETWIRPTSVFFLVYSFWLIWSWKMISKELFHPYIIFLLAVLLFNGGQVYLEAFNLNQSGILWTFSKEDAIKTVLFVLMSVSFLHLGALLAHKTIVKDVYTPGDKNIRYVGMILFIVSALPAVVVLKHSMSLALSSGYTSLYQTEFATGISAISNVLTSYLVPASIFMLAGSKNNKKSIFLSLIIVLTYAAIQFMLGLRGYMAMPLIAYLWTWHRCVRPIPKMLLMMGSTFMLVVVFPLVAVIRNVNDGSKFSIGNMLESFRSIDNPIVSILTEMGGSMSTITHTMLLVPSQRAYDMGVGYYYAFLTLIPNLFWDIHPSVAHGKYTYWLIGEVNPFVSKAGGSLGYSVFAEAFINFGWIGTPVVVFLIGYLFVKFVSIATSKNPATIALVASFLAFSLFFARSESSSIIRPLLWYAFLPYIAVNVLADFRKKKINYLVRQYE